MKFKVLKGTELYDKLTTMMNQKVANSKAADEFVKKVGGLHWAESSVNSQEIGRIAAVEFREKPEGWKAVGESWECLYFPKVALKALIKEISALPTIKVDDVNSIIRFKGGSFSTKNGFGWVSSYGLQKGKGCWLISTVEGVKYKPVEGMIEIVESEYKKLQLDEKKAK